MQHENAVTQWNEDSQSVSSHPYNDVDYRSCHNVPALLEADIKQT